MKRRIIEHKAAFVAITLFAAVAVWGIAANSTNVGAHPGYVAASIGINPAELPLRIKDLPAAAYDSF